jgi:predicted permease
LLNKIIDITSIVLPVFLVIALAYLSKIKKLFKQDVIDGIKTLIMNITLPAVVGFGLTFSRKSLKDAVFAAVSRMVIMAVLCAVALFAMNLFVTLNYYLFYAVLIIFTLPAAFILPMFAVDEKDNAYISTSLSLYTLVSIAAFAVIAVMVFMRGPV